MKKKRIGINKYIELIRVSAQDVDLFCDSVRGQTRCRCDRFTSDVKDESSGVGVAMRDIGRVVGAIVGVDLL